MLNELLFSIIRYERLMPVFEGEDMEVCIYPELSSGESLHIFVTHDDTQPTSDPTNETSNWRALESLNQNSPCTRKARVGQSM